MDIHQLKQRIDASGNKPRPITDQYIQLLNESWLRTRGGVRTWILSKEQIYDEVGLKDYFSKEVSSKSMTGVDVENSYF